MANLNPSQLPSIREDGGLFRELDVLERLRLGLPDGFEIFHEVTWHTIHEGNDRHGEIDIVVLSPAGDMLLMEVKAGSVLLREGGIFKRYGQQEKDVARQCRLQYAGMVARLKSAGIHPRLINCLVLPDYRIPAIAKSLFRCHVSMIWKIFQFVKFKKNGSAVSTAPASLALLLCLPAFTGEGNIARYGAEDAGLGQDRAHLRMPTRDADVLRSQVPGDPPGGGNQQDAGKGPYGTR